jgi:hypothetical protein
MRWLVCLVAALVVCSSSRAQEPPKPSPPATGEQEKARKGDDEVEDFKEEEPATPAERLEKEELEKRACPSADVKFTTATDKKHHPLGEPVPGKALVYVIRPTMLGSKIQTKLAVDARWVGVSRGHNYFFLQLDPGEHYFCSKAENTSVLAVRVEAGKSYYVEQKIKTGWMKARNKLALLGDEEGRNKLARCHPSSWQAKQ